MHYGNSVIRGNKKQCFGWHNRDQRRQFWEYPRQPVLLGPMTFTKYGTSSWERRLQRKTHVMLLHGSYREAQKVWGLWLSGIIEGEESQTARRPGQENWPKVEVTSFLLLAFLELRIVLWKRCFRWKQKCAKYKDLYSWVFFKSLIFRR